MQPRDVKTVADARRIVEERDIDYVKIGLHDVDGILRGKYVSRDKFYAILENGLAFCDVVLGWDSNDQLYETEDITFTGWHTGYPDAPVRVVPESCRDLPFEQDRTLLFLCQFDGDAAALCPRNVLGRVLERAAGMGLETYAALEYVFFLFNETPDSIREKGYRDLSPLTPGFFGYSVLRNSVHSDLYHSLLQLAQQMDFPIEGRHTETGPGVWEAAIGVDAAADAADKAALFKTFTKVWAQRQGLMATFMAKWSNDYPGQSGHIHLSLRETSGESAFYDASQPHCMSERQRQFVAGQQRYMPELTALYAQTVNAYSRMVPGFWAPTDATWGVENRTAALRVIEGSAKSQRVEMRLASADANPYLALAAAIGSGLKGIEEGLELGDAVQGNAYEQKHPQEQRLPATLDHAAVALRESGAARELFGDAFVDHYAASREWESREFRKHVSDWEMSRYFEII